VEKANEHEDEDENDNGKSAQSRMFETPTVGFLRSANQA
jgi:hypothetical protein